MQDLVIIIGVAAAAVLFAAAYSLYIRWKKHGRSAESVPDSGRLHKQSAAAGQNPRPKDTSASSAACPVCGMQLVRGENLVSKVFRQIKAGSEQEQRCTVLGCPHCYPVCEQGVRRTCPVCGKTVPSDGWLNARLYSRSTGKHHVRITGCTECHKKA